MGLKFESFLGGSSFSRENPRKLGFRLRAFRVREKKPLKAFERERDKRVKLTSIVYLWFSKDILVIVTTLCSYIYI